MIRFDCREILLLLVDYWSIFLIARVIAKVVHYVSSDYHNVAIRSLTIICLFVESSQGCSNNTGNTGKRNQEKSQVETSRKSNKWNIHMIDQEKGIKSDQSSRCSVKGDWSNLDGTRNRWKEEGGAFDQEESSQVDNELLVVGSNR